MMMTMIAMMMMTTMTTMTTTMMTMTARRVARPARLLQRPAAPLDDPVTVVGVIGASFFRSLTDATTHHFGALIIPSSLRGFEASSRDRSPPVTSIRPRCAPRADGREST